LISSRSSSRDGRQSLLTLPAFPSALALVLLSASGNGIGSVSACVLISSPSQQTQSPHPTDRILVRDQRTARDCFEGMQHIHEVVVADPFVNKYQMGISSRLGI